MSRPSSTLIQDHQIQQLEGLYDTVTYATPTNGKATQSHLSTPNNFATVNYSMSDDAFCLFMKGYWVTYNIICII